MLILFIILSALASFAICVFSLQAICSEYSVIILLPIAFLVFSLPLIEMLRKKKKSVYRTTCTLLIGIQWLRTVLAPATGSLCGFYSEIGAKINPTEANSSGWIMLYELVAVFLFATVLVRCSKSDAETVDGENMTLSGNTTIYSLFFLFAITLMLLTKTVPFQFIFLRAGTSTRLAYEQNGNGILDTVILYGLTFLVILIIANMHRKYNLSKREVYLNIAILAIIVRVSLISSESRLALVYQIGTGLMLMSKLFPERRPKVVRTLLITAIVVVGLLSIYKVFYAFLYSSYLDALVSKTGFGLDDIATQLDSYFYGVKTIARNLSYVESSSDGSLRTWIMDIMRNTFGLHYLFKGSAITTTEAYNLYLYQGKASSGYMFSSIAYGWMYHSAAFAPISTIVNLCFACFLEKRIRSIRFIEIYYIMCLAYIRLAVSQFAAFGGTWNYVSRTLVIGFLIIGFASIGRMGTKKRGAFRYQPVGR